MTPTDPRPAAFMFTFFTLVLVAAITAMVRSLRIQQSSVSLAERSELKAFQRARADGRKVTWSEWKAANELAV